VSTSKISLTTKTFVLTSGECDKIPPMKKVKKSDTYDPTIKDVLDVVQKGFARIEGTLSKHEGILSSHAKGLRGLLEGQQNLTERVNDIEHRLINTQNRMEDVADQLATIAPVVRKDRLAVADHERRILRLEKTGARA
jgi:septation ring formation regulator EzrA